MSQSSLEHQTAIALTAFASALCKQPSIDGQKLRMDFLDELEGLAQSPGGVEVVGLQIASLMEKTLQSKSAGTSPRRP